MKIACGWDHRGRAFADGLRECIEALGHEFVAMGAESDESSDYPDFAFRVGEAVGRGECERGVLLCGTGNGMAMSANKVPGIRAALAWDVESARLSRAHNDANVLTLGEQFASGPILRAILEAWLATAHEGGRHERRVNKIRDYEQRLAGQGTSE